MATVKFRGTHADVVRIAHQLAAIMSGRATETHGIAEGFMLNLGFGALSDIKNAYIQKSLGATDEAGVRWPKLAPFTVIQRERRRQRETKKQRSTREARLEKLQRRTRKEITETALRRFRMSLPEAEAQRRAQALGAQVVISGKSLQILRDTGVLFNSLGPGRLTGRAGSVSYSKPHVEGGEEQIFETAPGEVIVGTNVAYASTHQHGDSGRNIPARPFLPTSATGVPQVWWDRWTAIANKALVASAELLFRRST